MGVGSWVVGYVSTTFRRGWDWVAPPMSPQYIYPPNPVRIATTVAGFTAMGLAYWYWDKAVIDVDAILGSMMMSVVKIFVICAAILVGCGFVSLFYPGRYAQHDAMWLIRRMGGPAVAIRTLVGVVGGSIAVIYLGSILGPVALLVVLVLPAMLGACISVSWLGVRNQFRLGDAHPRLLPICMFLTGVWALVKAISRTADGGMNDALPVVAWILVTFVGPFFTMGLSAWDFYRSGLVRY